MDAYRFKKEMNYLIEKQLEQIEQTIKGTDPDNEFMRVLNLRYRELTQQLKL